MTQYTQDTGLITGSNFIGKGYSGFGSGINNPDFESVPDIGPIPKGEYKIVQWYDKYEGKGLVVARLEPVNHDAHGRNGFLIHGDNTEVNHTASHGCIVTSKDVRVNWRKSGDTKVFVV